MAAGDVVHVVPADDLVTHDTSSDGECVCGPTAMPVERDDGSMGWMVVHESLDRRERTEPTT